MVTLDCNLMNLNFFFFVDVDIYNNLILGRYIVPLYDIDLGILKALIVKMFVNSYFGTVYQIRGDLVSFNQSQFCFQIFTFGFLYPVIIDL